MSNLEVNCSIKMRLSGQASGLQFRRCLYNILLRGRIELYRRLGRVEPRRNDPNLCVHWSLLYKAKNLTPHFISRQKSAWPSHGSIKHRNKANTIKKELEAMHGDNNRYRLAWKKLVWNKLDTRAIKQEKSRDILNAVIPIEFTAIKPLSML